MAPPESDLSIEAPGASEVAVVPWSLLLRERVHHRVHKSDRYRAWVLLTVLAGMFSVGVTITILSVSLPRIASDLGSDVGTVTWVISGPILAFGVLGPAAGKAGDLWGHKRLYVASMVGAAIFGGLTALAPGVGSLIAFRILGAAAGSAAAPAGLAIINRLYPPEECVRPMGWFSFVGAGAPVIGVVIGGPVVEHLSWRLIFAVQLPLAALVAVVAALVLPETERRRDARFDVLGALTLGIGITSVLVGLNRGEAWGWTSAGVLGAFAAGVAGLALFPVVERRAPHPLIPLDYFRRRNFAMPAVAQLFINFAYMGGFILTPIYLQQAFGYGETRSGAISITRPIFFAITGPVAGYLAVRVGERSAGFAGSLAVVVSMVGLAQVAPGDSDLVVMAALALSGVGLGASLPAMQASVANSVDDADLGVAGATMQLMAQVGIAVGIQVMQAFQSAREPTVGLVASYQQAYLVGAAAAAVGVCAAWFVRSTERAPSVAAATP